LGFSKDRPSIDVSIEHPLPVADRAGLPRRASRAPGLDPPRGVGANTPLPSARSCQPPSSFRPCRSSRLRRFALLDTLQVCCTLQPIMGFATFQGIARLSSRLPCATTSRRSSPQRGVGERYAEHRHSRGASTLRSFPLADSRTASPRPMPSHRQAGSVPQPRPSRRKASRSPWRRHRPQGLDPSTSPLRLPGVSAAEAPDAPLGFRPT